MSSIIRLCILLGILLSPSSYVNASLDGLPANMTALCQRSSHDSSIVYFFKDRLVYAYSFTEQRVLTLLTLDQAQSGIPYATITACWRSGATGTTYFSAGTGYWSWDGPYIRDSDLGVGWTGLPVGTTTLSGAFMFDGPSNYFIVPAGSNTNVYKYDNIPDRVYPGQPQNITDAFAGIPVGATATRVPYTSSGMLLFVRDSRYWLWDPDLQRVRTGYPLTIGAPPVDTCNVFNEVSSYVGTLEDRRTGGSSLTYGSNINCTWTVLAPWNTTHHANYSGLQLMFSYFDVSGHMDDSVEIWENRERTTPGSLFTGFNGTSPLLVWNFTSANPPTLNQTLSFSSLSHSLTIVFKTYGPQATAPTSGQGRGWRLHYSVATPTVPHIYNLTSVSWATSMFQPINTSRALTYTPATQTPASVWVNVNVITPSWYSNETWNNTAVYVYSGAHYNRTYDKAMWWNGSMIADDASSLLGTVSQIYVPTNEPPTLAGQCTGQSLVTSDCIISVSPVSTNVAGELPPQVQIVFLAPPDVNIAAAIYYVPKTTCDGLQTFTASDGIITDGSGDLPYFSGQTCRWLVDATAVDGIGVRIDVLWLDIEPGADFLEIYDGNSMGINIPKRFTGQIVDPFRETTSTSYALIVLSAVSIPSKTRRRGQGFQLSYTVIARPEPRYCTYTAPALTTVNDITTGGVNVTMMVLEAGQAQTVTIQAVDASGRAMAYEFYTNFYFKINITGGYGYSNIMSSTPLSPYMSFTAPTLAGDYNFTVSIVIESLNVSQPIAGGIITLRVTAGTPEGTKSYMTGLVPTMTAGTQSNFTIQLRDLYSNPLLVGGQPSNTVRVFLVVESQAIHIPTVITDQYNGQYLVAFQPTVKAIYVPIVLVSGQEVDSSENTLLEVHPSDISAAHSELATPISGLTYNQSTPITITVIARDQYDNARDSSFSDWTVVVRSVSIDDTTLVGDGTLDDNLAKGIDVAVTMVSENSTAVTYQVVIPFVTQLIVSVVRNGVHIKNSPLLAFVGVNTPSDFTNPTGLMAGLGVVVVLLGIGVIVGFGVMVRTRRHVLIQAATLEFAFCLAFGALWAYCCVMIIVAYPPTSSLCLASIFTGHIAWGFMIGAIFCKVWHAQWALGWMETEVLVIGFRWSHMMRILAVELLYLAAWSLLSPPSPVVHTIDNVNYTVCESSNSAWPNLLLGLQALLLLYSLYHAFRIRWVPTLFNELRHLTIAMTNTIFVAVIILILSKGGIGIHPDAQNLIISVGILVGVTSILLATQVPRVLLLSSVDHRHLTEGAEALALGRQQLQARQTSRNWVQGSIPSGTGIPLGQMGPHGARNSKGGTKTTPPAGMPVGMSLDAMLQEMKAIQQQLDDGHIILAQRLKQQPDSVILSQVGSPPLATRGVVSHAWGPPEDHHHHVTAGALAATKGTGGLTTGGNTVTLGSAGSAGGSMGSPQQQTHPLMMGLISHSNNGALLAAAGSGATGGGGGAVAVASPTSGGMNGNMMVATDDSPLLVNHLSSSKSMKSPMSAGAYASASNAGILSGPKILLAGTSSHLHGTGNGNGGNGAGMGSTVVGSSNGSSGAVTSAHSGHHSNASTGGGGNPPNLSTGGTGNGTNDSPTVHRSSPKHATITANSMPHVMLPGQPGAASKPNSVMDHDDSSGETTPIPTAVRLHHDSGSKSGAPAVVVATPSTDGHTGGVPRISPTNATLPPPTEGASIAVTVTPTTNLNNIGTESSAAVAVSSSSSSSTVTLGPNGTVVAGTGVVIQPPRTPFVSMQSEVSML